MRSTKRLSVALAAFLLGLSLVGAQKENPIIDWLHEHGGELGETLGKCAVVPQALKETMSHSECLARNEPITIAALGLWYAITGVEHTNGTFADALKASGEVAILKSWATRKLMSATHEKISHFCEKPQCADVAQAFGETFLPCYTAAICTAAANVYPFDTCKSIIGKYMENVFDEQLKMYCVPEDPKTNAFFCSELHPDLLLFDFDCGLELVVSKPTTDPWMCDPRCKQIWHSTKAKLPQCSAALMKNTASHMEAAMDVVRELMNHSQNPDVRRAADKIPRNFSTFEDACGEAELASDIKLATGDAIVV